MCTDLSPLESTAAAVAVAGSVAGGVVAGGVVAGSVVDGGVVDRSVVDRGVVDGSMVGLMMDGSVVGLVVDVLGVFQGHISNHRHNLKGNISFDLRLRFFRPALVT